MIRHTPRGFLVELCKAAALLCVGVSLTGCATAALTTLGTVAGAVGPAFSAGREVFSMGKLDSVEPADFSTALAATHRAAGQLGLRYKPLPASAQSKDPTIVELRFYDDKCEKITVRLDRHAAQIVRIRIDVGLFGSEPTARLFLAAIRANLPAFPSGTTRLIAVPQAPIETGGTWISASGFIVT